MKIFPRPIPAQSRFYFLSDSSFFLLPVLFQAPQQKCGKEGAVVNEEAASPSWQAASRQSTLTTAASHLTSKYRITCGRRCS